MLPTLECWVVCPAFFITTNVHTCIFTPSYITGSNKVHMEIAAQLLVMVVGLHVETF